MATTTQTKTKAKSTAKKAQAKAQSKTTSAQRKTKSAAKSAQSKAKSARRNGQSKAPATKADLKDLASTAKLVQYLNEAYGKEKELETSLVAHIGMATRPAYKKRLQEHLRETKQHAKLVERRLKKLGGPGFIAGVTTGAVSRVIPAVKGQAHALRGTGPEEKQLKNAKTEYSEEHEEIATYTAIETLAEAVGDTETAQVARQIRREEERMASFLEKQIPLLTKEVVKAEIPASERRSNNSRSTRRRSTSRSTKRS